MRHQLAEEKTQRWSVGSVFQFVQKTPMLIKTYIKTSHHTILYKSNRTKSYMKSL